MNDWIPETDYNKIPVGMWLVEIDDEAMPYQIAYVHENITIVGNHATWDCEPLIAYKKLDARNNSDVFKERNVQ